MQLQSDPFLGWTTIEGRDYLVRQLNDHKASVELDRSQVRGLLEYAAVCGETLARGHARAGDPLVTSGYLGSGGGFSEALAKFGALYADQLAEGLGRSEAFPKSEDETLALSASLQVEGWLAAVPTRTFPPWQIALERGRNDFWPCF